MFYKMIGTARDRWFGSDDCTVKSLAEYIISTGQMRDAQVEAIKTYLFLKIACGNQPLASLFSSGAFNSLDLNQVEVSGTVRTFLEKNSLRVNEIAGEEETIFGAVGKVGIGRSAQTSHRLAAHRHHPLPHRDDGRDGQHREADDEHQHR